MKFPSQLRNASLALLAGFEMQQALAQSTCWVKPDNVHTVTYPLGLGTVYVPKDAKTGSVIGVFDQPFSLTSNEGRFVQCENDGAHTLAFNAVAQAPIHAGTLPPVMGEDVNGKVFETGISGIGAMIRLGHPFDGVAPGSFVPLTRPVVPFNALLTANVVLPVNPLVGRVTLIKTGPILPGPQVVDTALFYGRFSLIPRTMEFQLRATVMQAQCDSAVVSDDPVRLGDWGSAYFAAPGTGTTPVTFSIRLGNCESDPGDVNIAWANIRLDGVSGSAPVPGVSGAFSLTSDSTAQGIAVQIMRSDGLTPIPLGQDVPMITVSPGNTVLDMSARYYQIGDKAQVRPGLAKGALNFTVSYQ
ncbi:MULTISPECIES: fimbrial protein [Pseudomonas syringae group]|uniref:Fimbrial protein n=1 Tax=Pseudomonas syringae pv. primulae TaxID=251707 RepID=A0A0Q0D0G4_9PSED|nr:MULTISPECIES: fimbrial protein [Pseudomonas syringae group]KPY32651.1 Fimbrial protein [Pseudomonas syringae pv. primulae]MBD8187943.1 type 1 fimbrial protein [Pseudomonas viridiflava]MBD8200416.1 type 1 fimbrial protein [Pseudomonas viridiflava]MDY0937513.1 fimbrial protein [Pseudomonas viridiflava]MDY1013772.1 fimbrial protein [Pseudomonas viridiflava]